jgi:hypothetical protein
VADWTTIKAAWDQGWKALNDQAVKAYGAAIEADPTQFLAKIQEFMAALEASRVNIASFRARLPEQPRTEAERKLIAIHDKLNRRYHDLAAGFWSDAEPAREGTGIAPVIIVGGIVLGVAAIAWAVAAWEYAVNLREETALADRELAARVEASKQGRTLQPTTLPEPASEQAKKSAKGVGALVLGGLVLAAGAIAVPVLLEKKGGF